MGERGRDSPQTWALTLGKVFIFPNLNHLQTRHGHQRQKWSVTEHLSLCCQRRDPCGLVAPVFNVWF